MNEADQDAQDFVKSHLDPAGVIYAALNRLAFSIGQEGKYRVTIQNAMALYVLISPRLKAQEQEEVAKYLAVALAKNDFLSSLNLSLKVVEKANTSGLYFKTVPWATQEGSVWDGVDVSQVQGEGSVVVPKTEPEPDLTLPEDEGELDIVDRVERAAAMTPDDQEDREGGNYD